MKIDPGKPATKFNISYLEFGMTTMNAIIMNQSIVNDFQNFGFGLMSNLTCKIESVAYFQYCYSLPELNFGPDNHNNSFLSTFGVKKFYIERKELGFNLYVGEHFDMIWVNNTRDHLEGPSSI